MKIIKLPRDKKKGSYERHYIAKIESGNRVWYLHARKGWRNFRKVD